MYCEYCGKKLAAGSDYCHFCKSNLKGSLPKCSACGYQTLAGDRFCMKCGMEVGMGPARHESPEPRAMPYERQQTAPAAQELLYYERPGSKTHSYETMYAEPHAEHGYSQAQGYGREQPYDEEPYNRPPPYGRSRHGRVMHDEEIAGYDEPPRRRYKRRKKSGSARFLVSWIVFLLLLCAGSFAVFFFWEDISGVFGISGENQPELGAYEYEEPDGDEEPEILPPFLPAQPDEPPVIADVPEAVQEGPLLPSIPVADRRTVTNEGQVGISTP